MKVDAVFEGGGVKGIGLAGAMIAAEEAGAEFEHVAGTSAGAIMAALVAAGYRGQEIREILDETDYSDFKDKGIVDRIPLLGPVLSIGFENGIYEGEFLEKWLGDLLADKGVRTFADLVVHEHADDPKYRYGLRVVASDITRGQMLVLPQDIADYGLKPDNLGVAHAVRMSMSIPFFFEPIKLHDADDNVSYIVDGGILSNFPVSVFDSDGAPEWPTIGFKLVEPEDGSPNQITGPLSLFAAMFSTMMEAHDRRHLEDSDVVRTILIPTMGVRTTEFDLSKDKSKALFESGYEAGQRFFARWDFDDYKREFRGG